MSSAVPPADVMKNRKSLFELFVALIAMMHALAFIVFSPMMREPSKIKICSLSNGPNIVIGAAIGSRCVFFVSPVRARNRCFVVVKFISTSRDGQVPLPARP